MDKYYVIYVNVIIYTYNYVAEDIYLLYIIYIKIRLLYPFKLLS